MFQELPYMYINHCPCGLDFFIFLDIYCHIYFFLQPLLAMNYVHKRNNKILMMHLSHHAQPIIHFGNFVLERIQYRSKGVMNSTGSNVYEICLQASTISLLIRYFQGQQINWPSPSFQKI